MASVETFESTLKEVVNAKRVSASKMSTLTDIALKCMKEDTHLVSILYRTHKTLSSTGKINSLYVFDALARAARHQVNKQGLSADVPPDQGNCATFLMKMQGVLEGLFKDMISSRKPEPKEKTKKILDIWVKSNTFPSAVLEPLFKLLKEATGKESDKVVAEVTTDPRSQSTPSTTPPQPPPPPQPPVLPVQTAAPVNNDVQSTLLALLSQAANAVAGSSNGQTTPSIATAATALPQAQALNAGQLALLQQLAQTAGSGNAVPTQPVPVPLPVSLASSSSNPVSVVPPVGGPAHPPPYRNDQFGPARRDPAYDRSAGPEGGRIPEHHDDRRDFRGGFRGGFRGRGRGRGGWDDRDRFNDRGRDRDWHSQQRGRNSRSRSPTGRSYPARRDVKAYSPPRRPITAQLQSAAPAPGKDEFGRDLRASSPEGAEPQPNVDVIRDSRSPSTALSALSSTEHLATTSHGGGTPGEPSITQPAPIPVITSASETTSAPIAPPVGLDTFDMSNFNPSTPASWVALGNAWAVTNGYMPSEPELMQFAFTAGLMGPLPVTSQFGTQQAAQWPVQDHSWGNAHHAGHAPRGAWRGNGGFASRGRGRGASHGYGKGRDEFADRVPFELQETDAITLGGEDTGGYSNIDSQASWPGATEDGGVPDQPPGDEIMGAEGTPGNVGKMQRVGDKWLFVRKEMSDTT
ncbi:hypothetical protein CERSUDRAFT_82032 [Gelatoporia subvermispora B]|uniref:CID domain-containing protein n=1 Tax=Ceriporiopsis subvermispora (strain B) TaxID=914234 RepID=M2RKD4_CERS8|nr:hypothetical protein CERSUDRAFT_82032 [Gelatoporia subvermispora B]